jgi:hypothetical protein
VHQELANLALNVYSHSPIVYWWPVWTVGYILAALTWFQGVTTRFGDVEVLIHPSPALGVIFTATFLVVILITHRTARGLASVTVVVTVLALVLFVAYMGWWEQVLRLMGRLAIYMNLGFYVFFSTAVLAVWAAAVFFFDRFDYWEFRAGQAVHHNVLGDGEHAYDTRGMLVEKLPSDMFRHWILGLGAGDLHIVTTGAKPGDFVAKNVLFVGSKLLTIQRLAALKPAEEVEVVQGAGQNV